MHCMKTVAAWAEYHALSIAFGYMLGQKLHLFSSLKGTVRFLNSSRCSVNCTLEPVDHTHMKHNSTRVNNDRPVSVIRFAAMVR